MQPDPKRGAWLAQLQRFDAPRNPTMPGYRQAERIEPMEPPPVPGWVWGAASVAIVIVCGAIAWLIWFAG